MAGHSSSNFVCRICKDVFANQTFLDQHFLDVHPTKTSHHCNMCNEDFISELFLQIHETEYHTKSSTKPTTSPLKSLVETKSCIRNQSTHLKSFNNFGYLQKTVDNTLAIGDDNDDLFWCPVCFESYNSRENLRGHFRSSHIFHSDSLYICELCDIEKPSPEMLCWHLEVHSNNKLSVNRFSKLRTCLSSIKKYNTKTDKQQSKTTLNFHTNVTDEGTVKTKTSLNDTNNKRQKKLSVGDSTVQETGLKIENTLKCGRRKFLKEDILQKVALSRLKSSRTKRKKRSHSRLKSKSLKKKKLNRLPSKKLLLQANNTNTLHMIEKNDETVGNNISEAVSSSTTKMSVKFAKDKSLDKHESNVVQIQGEHNKLYETRSKNKINKKIITNSKDFENDKGRSEVLNNDDSISDQLLCVSNKPLEVESTNNSTATRSLEKVVDHETSPSKGNACYNKHENTFKRRVIESSINSDVDKEENVLNDLMNNSLNPTLETPFYTAEKQSPIAISILSKKGKTRFRNLRSKSSTKLKKHNVMNTEKSKQSLLTYSGSKPKCDSQESNNLLFGSESTLPAEDKSNCDTLLQFKSIEDNSQCKMTMKSYSAYNEDEQISKKISVEVPNGSKSKNECQNITKKITQDSKFKIPVIPIITNVTNKKTSTEECADDLKMKVLTTCENSNKWSTTFGFKNEEISQKETNLKTMLHKSCAKTDSLIAITSTNVDCGSSEKGLCAASDIVSQSMSEKIGSVEILNKTCVKNLGKSTTLEDLQETVTENLVLGESKQNSKSVPKKPLEEQNSKLVNIESNSLQSKSSEDSQNIEDDSQNNPNELFEEVSCDKCPLKFYNQDDLFDHIGSHYDI